MSLKSILAAGLVALATVGGATAAMADKVRLAVADEPYPPVFHQRPVWQMDWLGN